MDISISQWHPGVRHTKPIAAAMRLPGTTLPKANLSSGDQVYFGNTLRTAKRTAKPFKPFKLEARERQEILKALSYPRPQFVRNDWKSLNGKWDFAFDHNDTGLASGWAHSPSFEQKINVPFAYQVKRSGINDKSIRKFVWYKKNFEVPKHWTGPDKDLLLHFNAVDYKSQVWVNGIEVRRNQGGHVPFSINIAPYLKKDGPNQITLRVEDSQDADQLRGKQHNKGTAEGIDYYNTTGIWQNVWLEPVPKVRVLEQLKIKTLPTGKAVDIQIPVNAPRGDLQIEVETLSGEKVISQSVVKNAGGVVSTRINLPNAKLWSPDSPNLYDLKIRLKDKDGKLLDEVKSYFGVRTVGIKNGWITLNGKPIFFIGVLDQGYWPQSNITPPSSQSLLYDAVMTKRFGFNAVRKHQKVEDPRYLYLCDRLGLMVWGEMANSRLWSFEMEKNLEDEMAREIERDYNHPSIVAWVPLNESWGVHNIKNDPRQFDFAQRIVNRIRQLDPTRLVVDNDGWQQTNRTDIIGVHDYRSLKQMRDTYQQFKRGQIPKDGIPGQPVETFVQGAQYRGQPVVFTEIGGYLQIPKGRKKEEMDPLYNAYHTFMTKRELKDKYEGLMKTISDFDISAGFFYTQLTDVEQEMNGLMTYDRKPKIAPEIVAEINHRMFADKGAGGGVISLEHQKPTLTRMA